MHKITKKPHTNCVYLYVLTRDRKPCILRVFLHISIFLSVSLTWNNKHLTVTSAEHHEFPFKSVDLCLAQHVWKQGCKSLHTGRSLTLSFPSIPFCWMMAFIQQDKQHNKTERAVWWNATSPNTPHYPTFANVAHKAQVIHVASFIMCQLFCKVVQANYSFYFPHLHTHTEHRRCHFQKPSASSCCCGKVSFSRDQPQVSKEGSAGAAGNSSAPCEGFANQVISAALHHTGVYIRLVW